MLIFPGEGEEANVIWGEENEGSCELERKKEVHKINKGKLELKKTVKDVKKEKM